VLGVHGFGGNQLITASAASCFSSVRD